MTVTEFLIPVSHEVGDPDNSVALLALGELTRYIVDNEGVELRELHTILLFLADWYHPAGQGAGYRPTTAGDYVGRTRKAVRP